jgi:hypothetical protein
LKYGSWSRFSVESLKIWCSGRNVFRMYPIHCQEKYQKNRERFKLFSISPEKNDGLEFKLAATTSSQTRTNSQPMITVLSFSKSKHLYSLNRILVYLHYDLTITNLIPRIQAYSYDLNTFDFKMSLFVPWTLDKTPDDGRLRSKHVVRRISKSENIYIKDWIYCTLQLNVVIKI